MFLVIIFTMDDIRSVQESILSRLMKVLLLVALFALAAVSMAEWKNGNLNRIVLLYLPLFVAYTGLVFSKKQPHLLRVGVLSLLLMVLGISELLFFGYGSLAFLFFFVAAIIPSILIKPRSGLLVLAMTVLLILIFVVFYTVDLIPLDNPRQQKASDPANWLAPTVAYIMLFLAVHSAMGSLFSHLKKNLEESEEINRLLEHEKKALARTYEDLEQVAFKDTVTDLPNNKRLIKDIGKIIAENEGLSYYIHQVLVDIQSFEELNIKYGLDMGNEILRSLGFALASLPDCQVYRMTGAKFLIHCFSQTEKSREILDKREEQIHELMKTPVSLGKDALEVHYRGVSIQYPDDIANPTLLVPNLMMSLNDDQYGEVDTIMHYSGKKAGKIIRKNTIQEMMNNALEKGELSVFIQPRMNLSDGTIRGGELLTRWDSRYYGAISPTEFIPIAELSHHIIDLTHFVFRAAADYCRFFAGLPSSEAHPFTLSVNISPMIIKANRMDEFIQYTRPLRDCGHFEFELTEGFFLNLTDMVQKQMHELHANHIKVAVDDFGTGYSNLEYLQELNVDVLKIDRKFVRGIPHDKKMTHLVLAIVNMAKALELRTVAEGVEYQEQLKWLQAQGVDEIQGFLLAKPMDLSYFRSFFAEHDPQRWI